MSIAELAPRTEEWEIGIRKFRKIDIYPLSMHDQMEMTDIIQVVIETIFLNEDSDNQTLIKAVVDTVKKKVIDILSLIASCTKPEARALLKEISNDQFDDLLTLLYKMNYEKISKNLQSLFEAMSPLFLSRRPLPESSSDTPSTDSTISSASPSETEV